MKLEFSRQIFEKKLNIKFYKNPSSGSRDVPSGWTDGQRYFYFHVTVHCNKFIYNKTN